SFHREARYTSSHRGKRHRLEAFLLCTQQGVARRGPQFFLHGAAAQLHAGRVDYVARLEVSAAGERGLAERNRTDAVGFLLDGRAAFSPDRAGHAAAELQIIVRGIDDRVGRRLGKIALADSDPVTPSACHRTLPGGTRPPDSS